jgi:hypothetical protein
MSGQVVFVRTRALSFTSRAPVDAVALAPESRIHEETNHGQLDPS